jgi:hypothetical protein
MLVTVITTADECLFFCFVPFRGLGICYATDILERVSPALPRGRLGQQACPLAKKALVCCGIGTAAE